MRCKVAPPLFPSKIDTHPQTPIVEGARNDIGESKQDMEISQLKFHWRKTEFLIVLLYKDWH